MLLNASRTGFITVIITKTHLMCFALMLFAHAVHPELRQFYHLSSPSIIIAETSMSPSWFVCDSINLRFPLTQPYTKFQPQANLHHLDENSEISFVSSRDKERRWDGKVEKWITASVINFHGYGINIVVNNKLDFT